MIEAGILNAETRSAANVLNYAVWLTLAQASELYIRKISNQLIAAITDTEPDDWEETFTEKIALQLAGNIPFVGSFVGSIMYGSVPVPAISLAQQVFFAARGNLRTDDPDIAFRNGLIASILGLGIVGKFPGAVQTAELIRKKLSDE